ncbi:MAG: HU family DNA-binding protein [Planctomycetales bacterium]
MVAELAETTELSKDDVNLVFDALSDLIEKNLGKKGPGAIAIHGLLKIQAKAVPAKPARKGVPNPFKPGELMDVAAKPASVKVKALPLKKLKDMVL